MLFAHELIGRVINWLDLADIVRLAATFRSTEAYQTCIVIVFKYLVADSLTIHCIIVGAFSYEMMFFLLYDIVVGEPNEVHIFIKVILADHSVLHIYHKVWIDMVSQIMTMDLGLYVKIINEDKVVFERFSEHL